MARANAGTVGGNGAGAMNNGANNQTGAYPNALLIRKRHKAVR